MKYSVRATLLVMSLLAALLAPIGNASATTDYDGLLQTTPSLSVYTDGSTMSETMDISGSWWANYKQAYAKRVAQNIGWPTNFASEFEAIMSTGGSWGVYVHEGTQGNVLTIVGTRDPNATCEFSGPATTGSFQCTSSTGYGFVTAPYFTHNSYGGNGCIGSYQDRCSANGMGIYSEPTVYTGTAGGTFLSLSNSALSNYKFYFMNFDINYPDPGYEGIEIPETKPHAEYVAMGDSFSSGEGVEVFEAGTDDTDINECHRSLDAYPRVLQQDPNLSIESLDFVACSGATTRDVLGISEANDPEGKWHSSTEPAQIDALSENTDLVTITVGGNDAKFSEFAYKCIGIKEEFTLDQVCDEYTDIYEEVVGLIENSLPTKLEEVYTEILERAPNAEVYVGGYPRIAPYKYISDSFDSDCGGLYDEFPNTWGDARAAYDVVNLLNDTIVEAVDSVNTQESTTRLHFVYVAGGAFAGHDICETLTYFNDIDLFNPEYTIHPNYYGQLAYASDFEDDIS